MIRYMLLGVTLAYRLIPGPVRGLWRLNGPTSHLALAGLREGRTDAFRAAVGWWVFGEGHHGDQ